MKIEFVKRVVLSTFVALVAVCARAETETVDGIMWTYTVSNGEARIGGGTSNTTAVPKSTKGGITIPSTLGGYPVTSIGEWAFVSCYSLTSVTIPNSVTSIGYGAFIVCSGLTSVTIPNSVTSIGDEAFRDCSSLTSVTIPNSVTSIGDSAFSYCYSLTSVTIPNSVTSIGDSAFSYCDSLTSVTIPNSVTSIGEWAFSHCSSLKSVTIPNSVTSIGDSAFSYCDSLTSVTMPNSVTSIGDGAFSYCYSLTSVTIPNSVTSIGDFVFRYCSLTSVTIPNSVTSIGEWAFSDCSSLKSVTIPDSVTSIGYAAFIYCDSLTSVTIPNSVTSIGNSAFDGCSSLTSVTIPNSVTSIGDNAFDGCNSLKSVTIPQCVCSSGMESIFASSRNSITNIVIHTGVTYIDGWAFYFCSSLRSITIPDSVTSIGYAAFDGCSSLTSVTIPNSVTSIGHGAFSDCSSLTSVTIPNSVTYIDGWAFYFCSSLTSVTIPNSVTSIGHGAFSDCSSLTNIVVPDSVTSIGSSAFNNCSSLKSVAFCGEVPSGVSASGILSNADSVRYYREYASSYEEIVPASKFGGYLPESVDEFLNMPGNVFTQSDERPWIIDTKVSSDGEGAMRSGKIGVKESTWIETVVNGPGKLTFKWKASSEYYEDKSSGVYEIYDYGYLMVDGVPMGKLDGNSMTNGIAIGGHTDWQDVEFDVTGEGEHTLRWTYQKDKYDDEQMIGEDCIWVDQIKFRPYVTLSFDLGGGVGETPRAIYELHESKIILPADAGFTRDNHVFDGWSNGDQKYAAGEAYEMPRTNVTLRAQWIEKRALSFDLGGGSGTAPSVIKDIPGSVITLPDTTGFDRAKYTFTGWNDGERTHAAGASYTIAGKDVVFTAQWRANTISTPVISSCDIINGGVLNTASATISISADSGVSVYYTLDGSTPNAASVKYTAPFVADGLGSVTIKAIALRDNYFDSEVATFSFIRRPYSAAECLGVNGFAVVTEGDNAWFRVQDDSAHDGESALRSGAIGEGGSSVVQMTVYGRGTISFWWKSSSHDGNRNRQYDYVSFEVDDGGEQAWLGGEKDWVNVTYDVPDEGEHTLKWIYKKNSDGTTAGEDCAWLDEVMWMGGDKFVITYENLKGATHQNPSSYYEGMIIKFTEPSAVNGYTFSGWTPSAIAASDIGDKVVTANWEWTPQDAVVDATVTGWKPITVKADWAKTELEQKFGAGKQEEFISKFGADLTSAMTQKTGKKDVDGNELLVWHDYVAGTDPTDINSTFKAIIDVEDGKPVVSWEPDLNSLGEERVYTVHGKENLSDIWHSPITALDHFFKVDVSMPYDVIVTLNAGDGASVAPISVRVGQPVGELPTPTRDEYTFLGWFTAAEGGVAVTPETVVTANMTIYAKWKITHEKVQLWAGGPYWATTNIGAEKPEDYGYYFWWGDTVGYKRENEKWVASDGSNLNFSFSESNTPTYNKSISTLQSEGWITADGVLAPEHDAAHAHWGGGWRMPTIQEFYDLNSKCDWVWTTVNGVNGYVVRGRGEYMANSIFLPCTGYVLGTSLHSAGSYGNYWSSVPDPDYIDTALYLLFFSDAHGWNCLDHRIEGQSVRPVQGAICVTVTFDTCGGSSVDSISIPPGQALGELPTPARDGYTFLGWFTASEGGNAVTSETIVASDMTIYARWTIKSYTVVFDANGGSGGVSKSYNHGATLGEMPVPTRYGYTFLGWFTAVSGGTQAAASTVVTGPNTLYAQWTIKSYTVVFDANGGSGGVSKSYTHGAALGELPTPTRDGYTFLGWFMSASGGTQVAASTVVTGPNTLYAQWEEITSLTLSGALDIEGSGVTVGGNVEWFGQTDISYDAVDSAQSGDISDNQTSWMEVVVKDVSSVSFWWKVSSESNYDKLHFYVDGTEVVDPISGQRDWIKVEYALEAGSHTLKWSYTKDVSVSNGDDCGWVDSVVLSPSQSQTHDKVQLWENGPYWATTNIGAEKPEDSGYYFWWGDTIGYKRENDKWVASDGSNSNFSFGSSNTPTYNKSISTLENEGWITADGVLAPEHDAAQKHWGGDWRMPTKQEFDNLISKCDWTWGSMNGVNGYVIRGKGDYSSASIFLPCAGRGSWTTLDYAGSFGLYWSSVLDTVDYFPWCLHFILGYRITGDGSRDTGQPIRPVQGFTK